MKLTADVLLPLTRRSNRHGALRAAGHLGAIALSSLLLWSALGSVWALPLTLLQGYLVAFLFNALHETAHNTAFRSRWANQLLGHFAGFAVLLPYEYYRAFHWDHHRYTQDPARDPELFVPLPTTRWRLMWAIAGWPTWAGRLRMLLVHGLLGRVEERWVAADKRTLIANEARACLAGYALVIGVSLWFGSLLAMWLWLLPLVAGQWLLRPYLLAEHTGCANSSDMLANTRTTYTNTLVRFFAWNMPFHAEHHAYPAVPFHALPQLNARLAAHIVHTEQGYPASAAAVWQSIAALEAVRQHRQRA